MELLLNEVVKKYTFETDMDCVKKIKTQNKKYTKELKLIRRGFGKAENLQIPKNNGLSYEECLNHYISKMFNFINNPKIISKKDMDKICSKYELTVGSHRDYKGTIPLRIADVLDNYYDIIKPLGSISGSHWDDQVSRRGENKSYYKYITDYSQESYNPFDETYDKDWKLKFYTGLWILAPNEMFEVQEPIKEDPALFVRVKIEKYDNSNICSKPCYLMLASWGPEQFIPELQSKESN